MLLFKIDINGSICYHGHQATGFADDMRCDIETACPRDEEWKMIKDAASGPEMLECLTEKGHREIFRRCLEELGDCNISDVDEEVFAEMLNETKLISMRI